MKIEEVICDQCGARKGKTNHWLKMEIIQGSFHLYKSQSIHSENNKDEKDICGGGCAMKALQDFIDPPTNKRNDYGQVVNDPE